MFGQDVPADRCAPTQHPSLQAVYGRRALVQSGFHAVTDCIFNVVVFSLSAASFILVASLYFPWGLVISSWNWHKLSLNYVEITGVIAFIAPLSIDDCPAGYWLYTRSSKIYVLLRHAVQYKYNTTNNIQSIINPHHAVGAVRTKVSASLCLGLAGCLISSLVLIMSPTLIFQKSSRTLTLPTTY